ncbi:MAG: VanZ family protein [Candidatus Sabulitectum sp.]|nr:VanZ family protein [Candidatus Sabulitectum sp.]
MNRAKIPQRLFLISVASLIVYLSHQPSLKPPLELFPHQDKLFHMVEFGGLGLALVLNADLFGKKNRQFRMVFSGVIWAVLDELHQSFVPGRDSSFQDIFADTVGLFVAVWFFSRAFMKVRNRYVT